jgi:hypothetical protein
MFYASPGRNPPAGDPTLHVGTKAGRETKVPTASRKLLTQASLWASVYRQTPRGDLPACDSNWKRPCKAT